MFVRVAFACELCVRATVGDARHQPTTHEPLSTASSVTPTSASNSTTSGGGKKRKSKILHQLTGLLGFRQQASANLQTPNSSSWSTSSSSGRSLPYAPASSSSSSPIRDKLSKMVGKPRDKVPLVYKHLLSLACSFHFHNSMKSLIIFYNNSF